MIGKDVKEIAVAIVICILAIVTVGGLVRGFCLWMLG
jgi:nitrate reductase NapE component